MSRPGNANRTPHSTLTDTAARAARALRARGLLPYPGVISAKRSRSAPRVVVTVERGRVRVTVSGGGIQDIHLYGQVAAADVMEPLEREFGADSVRLRDRERLWTPGAGRP